jgi:ribonuclease D
MQEEKMNVHYLTTDAEVRQWVARIKEMDPKVLAVDFETASKNGRFGSTNGALRLVQLAVDEPERGIAPTQVVIDCFHADPGPVKDLFRDPEIEKQIHYMDFEQEWAQLHIGSEINNVYDTCIASRVIQNELQKMDPEEIEHINPGWEKHDNRLATLLRNYLGMEMPKENQASDWGREDLNGAQVVYATMDVVTLPPLVREIKALAERAGATETVESRTKWIGGKITERVRDRRKSVEDDSSRLERALGRATSRDELERIWASRRQMTIFSGNNTRLKKLYREKRSSLD